MFTYYNNLKIGIKIGVSKFKSRANLSGSPNVSKTQVTCLPHITGFRGTFRSDTH